MLNVDEAAEKLRQRRSFERTLPLLTISPNIVRILRCGAFVVIGQDVLRRPILYVKMGLYRASPDDDDTQKLVLVLLEYLMALAGGGVSIGQQQQPLQHQQQQQQEVVLLVNEQAAGWLEHNDLLRTQSLLTLVPKYYPELVGQVLLVDAPWSVRHAVRSTLSSSNSGRARTVTQLVSKNELAKYMDVSVIPEELGGRNKTQIAPGDFCENVLRHWYCTTTVLQAEIMAAAQQHSSNYTPRPLWQMPVVVGGGVAAIDRAVSMSRQVAHAVMRSAARGPQRNPKNLSSGRRQSSLLNSGDTATDDGQCSVISEDALDVANEDDIAFSDNEGPSRPSSFHHHQTGGAAGSSSNNATAALAAELDLERQRRQGLEQELAKLQLGISIDDAVVTQLEAALRQIHNEVNVLTAEVVLRANAASKAAAISSRPVDTRRNEPTLHALLTATNAAILAVVQQRQPIGAMKFAAPMDRKSKSSCSVM
jgi:hypothetical protein